MSNVQKVSIALTKEMNAKVQEAVASGQYASASEVVRDALRDWEEKQQKRAEAIVKLKAMIQEGIDSGPAVPWNATEMLQEFRNEFASRSKLKKSA